MYEGVSVGGAIAGECCWWVSVRSSVCSMVVVVGVPDRDGFAALFF